MKRRPGKVFLVGAGPGDPGLVTVRGARLIRQADAIVMDALVSPALVAGASAEVIDAGKRGPPSENERAHGPSQSHINRLLVRLARSGKTVVRLKGGDPFVFGRGSEELEALRAAGIDFEVVPGVSSASAVPAYAGIPITDRRWSSQVTIVTGHERPGKVPAGVDWERLSPRGTLVVLMGVLSWPRLSSELIRRGWRPSLPVAAIERGATPRQRVIHSTLGASAAVFRKSRLTAPAIVVVGRVASLGRRLSWLRRERPLFGRRIVVTRSRGANDRLALLLETEGAEILGCPLIRVRPLHPPLLASLRYAAAAAPLPYDWLIFLSANAVRIFSSLWPEAPSLLSHVPVAAVGPLTAQAAREAGWRVRKTPAEFNSSGIRRALGALRGKRLLLPRAKIAPPDLIRALERAGARVDVPAIYETEFLRPPVGFHREFARGVDAITFLSASTVESFARAYPGNAARRMARKAVVISIGTATTAAIRRWLGVRPIEAPEATAAGVLRALRRHFAAK